MSIRLPNQNKQYAKLNSRLARYVAAVESLYRDLCKQTADAVTLVEVDGVEKFKFNSDPILQRKIDEIQQEFVSNLRAMIYSGTSDEWKRSNLFQDLIADRVLKKYKRDLTKSEYNTYYRDNSDALKAFQYRRDRGLNLSQKLWKQSAKLKTEMEDALSCSIEKGMDAVTLSKRLSRYLSDFPLLQTDYKEKFGTASKAVDCEYRSIRLARSEINMAYRTAEQTRWRQFDFVVGYEIKLSHSHPSEDVCDSLAGKYPKDFVWSGWHPNDLCYCIPILKSEEEFLDDNDKQSANEITDVPQEFKDWCIDNKDRISAAIERDTLPYFLRNNIDRVNTILTYNNAEENTMLEIVAPHGAMNNEERTLMRNLSGAISNIPKDEPYLNDINASRFLIEEYLDHKEYSEYHDVVNRYRTDIENAVENIKKGDYRMAENDLKKPRYSIIDETDFLRKPYCAIHRRTPAIVGADIDYTKADEMLGSYGSLYHFMLNTSYNNYDELYAFFGGISNIKQELTRLSENSSVFMSIKSSTLEKKIILGDGRFKNSLETGSGTFKTIGEERAIKEKMMFGLAQDTDSVTMPKYGFMATKGDMDYEKIVGWGYGDCYVEFKPEVKSRATMTWGDSYDGNRIDMRRGYYTQSAPPVPIDSPEEEFLLSMQWNNHKLTPDEIRSMQSFSQFKSRTYIEAQLYGDVRIEDVDCIYVEGKKHMASMRKAVERKGLSITVKPCRYDSRLKLLENPLLSEQADKLSMSLSNSDIDALGDYYINCLCKAYAEPYPSISWNTEGEFESWWTATATQIKKGEASMGEKREFLKRYYAELDKKEKSVFPKARWNDRKPNLGGWTSDVIDEELLKRSK